MKLLNTLVSAALFIAGTLIPAQGASFRFIKSQSGPSGKIVENRFIFDKLRTRFVYPLDKSLTVHFEWEAPPGDHTLPPGLPSGVWTLEIRIDGEPSGSHPFELVTPEPPKKELPPPSPPSLDQIYASVQRSLVWIYKLDEAGRRTDTSLGFVMGPDQIATALSD